MKPSTKKYLTWIAIALVVFYVLSDPAKAAASVDSLVAQVKGLADKIVQFLTELAT